MFAVFEVKTAQNICFVLFIFKLFYLFMDFFFKDGLSIVCYFARVSPTIPIAICRSSL